MVNVSTQLSAKMEAPYGEYSVPPARRRSQGVGPGAASSPQPHGPKAGDGGSRRVLVGFGTM